jgi:hypothetical protein
MAALLSDTVKASLFLACNKRELQLITQCYVAGCCLVLFLFIRQTRLDQSHVSSSLRRKAEVDTNMPRVKHNDNEFYLYPATACVCSRNPIGTAETIHGLIVPRLKHGGSLPPILWGAPRPR